MYRLLFNLVILIALNFNLNAQRLPEGYPITNRQKTVLTNGWMFHLDKGENGLKKLRQLFRIGRKLPFHIHSNSLRWIKMGAKMMIFN